MAAGKELAGYLRSVRWLTGVFGVWFLFFGLSRLVFLVYHSGRFSGAGWASLRDIVLSGSRMDASMAGYASILPFVLWLVSSFLSPRPLRLIFWVYTLFFMALFALMAAADLEIFAQWGHRLDAAVLPYLAHPREAMASSGAAPIGLLSGIAFLLFFAGWGLWLLFSRVSEFGDVRFRETALALPALALLVLPIRGGFQLSPMNQSMVYFSTVREFNQAAENCIWVFFQSLGESNTSEMDALYRTATPGEAEKFRQSLYPPDSAVFASVLKNGRPNVVLVVWESLTAKVAGHLGGRFPSTPALDSLAGTGLRFTRFFASGDRSDKGLAAILASVPALGKLNIMAQPNLGSRLPFLPRFFKDRGYQTAFLYGGELEFANIRSFMLEAGFDRLIGKNDFPQESWNSKWGAHDGELFSRQIREAAVVREPFFHVLFTLSSHEPFEVPGEEPPPGLSADSLFCRAHRYTDRCFRRWLHQASRQDWWQNTLVIVVADHGHTAPGKSREWSPEKFRIPMVWAGPALLRSGEVPATGGQTDLAKTLRRQLGDSTVSLPFSRNLFAPSPVWATSFAFRNGFTLLGPGGSSLIFDPAPAGSRAQVYRTAVYNRYYRNSSLP